jgi:hypothetical protein
LNWLRVSGPAELPQIDQGVHHQLHAKMSLLNMFKPQEQPLEFVLPCERPIDSGSQGMNGGIESPLPPTLRGFAIARILFDVGDHACIENAFAIVRRIKARIEIDIGAFQVQIDLFGDLLQGF